jgi:hypothetical protein
MGHRASLSHSPVYASYHRKARRESASEKMSWCEIIDMRWVHHFYPKKGLGVAPSQKIPVVRESLTKNILSILVASCAAHSLEQNIGSVVRSSSTDKGHEYHGI